MTAPPRWLPLVASVVFAAAYTQPPLYFSNQNQYFLHGLADAGFGDLRSDWLAKTADPTPAFSAGVALTYHLCGEWPYYVCFFALLMTYFLAMWSVASALPFAPRTTAGQAVLAACLILVHSSIVRVASAQWLGVDYPWYFQTGIAHQYVLGAGLQPSVFGVLLIVALAAFVHGRPVLAGALAAAACMMHSTYLLVAGLLVAGMLVGLWREGRRQTAALCGGIALVGVVPVIAYTLIAFGPSDAETFARAQEVIARERIPHHTDVNRWLDWVGGVQIAWIIAGIAAFRKTSLFVPLVVAAGAGLLLSLVAIASGHATLSLLFPWRVSAVLVPVATVAACAALARLMEAYVGPRWLSLAAFLAAVAALASAAWVYVRPTGAAEAELIHFVRANRQPGDVYLLPAALPPSSTKRGVGSMTFVPPKPGRPVVFELERFRLATGAAAYIDSKSIPYKDSDVLEWRRRVANCERWYANSDWDKNGTADEVAAEGVTHIVVPAGVTVHSSRVELVHDDPAHRVYRIRSQ